MPPDRIVVCGRGQAEERVAGLARRIGLEVDLAADGYRAVELVERVHPGFLLFPDGLPGPGAGDLLQRVRTAWPACRSIVVLHSPGPDRAVDLIRAGAAALLLDEPDRAFLLWTLARVREGGLVLSPLLAQELARPLAASVDRTRQWARELRQRARQVEALSRVKADFLSNVSHELRTPLTIIKGVASTLARSGDEAQAALLDQAERAADKLAEMVDGLLARARVQSGEFALRLEDCDLAQLVATAAEEQAAVYPHVAVEVDASSPIPLRADARALRGVLGQLLDNACRYSEPGDRVTVRAVAAEEGATVHVTDRGRGVQRGSVSAAFDEAFSPGEQVLTKDRAGLGIGLNLARHLLALHGGILWAEPLPGGGSRVSFTIPPYSGDEGNRSGEGGNDAELGTAAGTSS